MLGRQQENLFETRAEADKRGSTINFLAYQQVGCSSLTTFRDELITQGTRSWSILSHQMASFAAETCTLRSFQVDKNFFHLRRTLPWRFTLMVIHVNNFFVSINGMEVVQNHRNPQRTWKTTQQGVHPEKVLQTSFWPMALGTNLQRNPDLKISKGHKRASWSYQPRNTWRYPLQKPFGHGDIFWVLSLVQGTPSWCSSSYWMSST